jgi:hypothetical protein
MVVDEFEFSNFAFQVLLSVSHAVSHLYPRHGTVVLSRLVLHLCYETQRVINRNRMVDMDAETTQGTRPTSNFTIQSIAVVACLSKFCNSAALETQFHRLLTYYLTIVDLNSL